MYNNECELQIRYFLPFSVSLPVNSIYDTIVSANLHTNYLFTTKGQFTVIYMSVDKGEFACFVCVSGAIVKLSSNNGGAVDRRQHKLTSLAILFCTTEWPAIRRNSTFEMENFINNFR